MKKTGSISIYQKDLLKYSDEVDNGVLISIPNEINPVIGVLQEENKELKGEI